MRLIHISDPHLTSLRGISPKHLAGKRCLGYASWRWRRRHRHLASYLDELCAAAAAEQPDVVLVTGDLVHLGLPGEIEAAATWLRALGPVERVFLVPGNHDLYRGDSWAAVEVLWGDYLRLAPRQSDEPGYWAGFPTRLCLDGIHIHGLNTGVPTAPLLQATGKLGGGQCERLVARLAAAPSEALHIVALHHPPAPGVVPGRKALSDMGLLAPVLDQAHLVLHGHGHFNSAYRHGAVRVFAINSASMAHAAFRCFDISRHDDHWRVAMRLVSRGPQGFATRATETFAVPRQTVRSG